MKEDRLPSILVDSLSHIEGITLGAGEEVDEIAGGASGMDVGRIVEMVTGLVILRHIP